MNREIKFRGKRTDNSEWVYGYLFSGNKSVNGTLSSHYYIGTLDNYQEIIPESVGQLTGLTDKEIYEGDIIKKKYNNGYCHLLIEYRHFNIIARFLNNMPHQYVIGLNECEECEYYNLFQINHYELEIIGKIYENPELK